MKIKISDYPYGRVTKRLKETIKWLNTHKKQIRKDDYWDFDYPHYCGLPIKLANRLSPDEVDFIQEQISEITIGYQKLRK